jgi:hypothetical protein
MPLVLKRSTDAAKKTDPPTTPAGVDARDMSTMPAARLRREVPCRHAANHEAAA